MALACLAFSVSVPLAADPSDTFIGTEDNLDITGGTAHIPVMQEAARRIMAANLDIRITVAKGGSGVQKADGGWSRSVIPVVRSRNPRFRSTAWTVQSRDCPEFYFVA